MGQWIVAGHGLGSPRLVLRWYGAVAIGVAWHRVVGGGVLGASTGDGLSCGVDLTRSRCSSGQGRIVSGGVFTLPLP